VQTALGAIVVLTTSTLNRIMVVELALPATLPGALVAMHYAIQLLRPRLGYGSDVTGRATPWIVGGMAVLAAGGLLASIATAWLATSRLPALLLAVVAFLLIGAGVGASGTSLLALLAKRVDEGRRAAAATIVWLMMIAGIAATAGVAGSLLDPFSPARLVAVGGGVAVFAFLLTLLAVAGVERDVASPGARRAPAPFRLALAEAWREPRARRFTIFVFVSMFAYSAQDLILEPFAGLAFGFTPGQSTRLAGIQHSGVLLGLIVVALAGSFGRGPLRSLPLWIVGGCVASAGMAAGLALAGLLGTGWPLRANVFALGVANGALAIAAIGAMMALAGQGRGGREGIRVGMWGGAQAIAFGLGGFSGTLAADLARRLLGSADTAYGAVFAAQALLFLVSAGLALRVWRSPLS
jgi:BCD family chlorophyll transporter-like MFS transporter